VTVHEAKGSVDERENEREYESERTVWCVRCSGIIAFCGSYISEPSLDSPKALKRSLSSRIGINNPSSNCLSVENQMHSYCETGSRMEKLEEN
jgi:hypothetical protein